MISDVQTASLHLKTRNGDFVRIDVDVSDESMHGMSRVAIPRRVLDLLPNVPIADDTTKHVDVELMIGNDYYDDLVFGSRIPVCDGFRLVDSEFGWILSGRLFNYDIDDKHHETGALILTDEFSECRTIPSLEDLWRLETIGIKDEPNPVSDDEALEAFNRTVQFYAGEYQVTWPWRCATINDGPSN